MKRGASPPKFTLNRIPVAPMSNPHPNNTAPNPLMPLHEQAEAGFIAYGLRDSVDGAVQVVDTFGSYEAEYAAIRKSAGLMDLPHRAVIRVTGGDRVDFLHRMLTNAIVGLEPGKGLPGVFAR